MSRALAICAFLSALLLLGATPTAVAQSSPEDSMPPTVNICVVGATIAPTRADGSPWRGNSRLPPEVAAMVDKKIAAFEQAAVASVVPGGLAANLIAAFAEHQLVAAMEKPKVFGRVELAPTGAFTNAPRNVRSFRAPVLIGSIQPRFRDICFNKVPWNYNVRLLVDLKNAHLGGAIDEIGQVEIDEPKLKAAFDRGVSHVIVRQQNRNIISVLLTVTK